ncbi:uncharacterized protein LOC114812293 isoform X1 [Ornithorhynchus anatinus]|uniref:uncharacterized protein LOC114812293 isoform X1 n=1 Tax=Ornithorhynchus anatinus TaxID=9258 RepID=UPI0010A838B2|nr:uncharacterized protein LOC114812293 isoform X1 [Ornithorhynchus anatinus]
MAWGEGHWAGPVPCLCGHGVLLKCPGQLRFLHRPTLLVPELGRPEVVAAGGGPVSERRELGPAAAHRAQPPGVHPRPRLWRPQRLPGLLDGLQAVPLPGPKTSHSPGLHPSPPPAPSVNRHLGLGFMFLGLVLTSILVPCLGLSFRRIFHRLTHCDLVLGIISCISAAFVLLSMTLFTLECETLHPDGRWPLIDYTLRYYLGWLAGMLLGAAAGTCLTNHLQSQTCHCWGQERSSSQSLEEHQPSSKDDSQDWGKEILLGPVSDPSLSKVSSSSSTSSANLNTAVAKSSISLDLQASRPTPRPSGPPPSGSAPGGRIRPLHCPLGR